MFSRIDDFLITWSQWLVRQLELYTPVERKGLANFCLLLLKYSIIAMAILILFKVFVSEYDGSIYIFGILVLIFSFDYFVFKTLFSRQKDVETSLPREIITRVPHRYLMILASISSIGVIFPLLITAFLSEGIYTPQMLLITFNWGIFLIKLCLELILCTTSMSHGEKQKRLEEKEMRNLQLIPTQS